MSIHSTLLGQGRRILAGMLSVVMLLGSFSCGNEITPEDPDDKPETPVGPDDKPDVNVGDLEIIDGKARLYVCEPEASLRSVFGNPITDWSDYTVTVADKEYKVLVDDDGKAYVDVEESADGTYAAVLTSEASELYGTGYEDVLHPFAYAYHTAAGVVASLPQYASYSKENGAVLTFSTGMALLEITLKGTASVASVYVQDPSGSLLGGSGAYDPSNGTFTMVKGVDFVSLNTTSKGNFVPLTDAGTKFLVPVPAGSYPQGLDVRVCDSEHKMCSANTGAFEVGYDRTHTFRMKYSPAKDLLFFEGFDNFVWGGDVVGGSATFALNPKDETVTTTSFRTLTGYEQGLYPVAYDVAGSGYIQKSSQMSEIAGKTVSESRNLSASYIKSRNVGDYVALYKVQEHQGYIALGTAESYNGIFEPAFGGSMITMQRDVQISFDFCPRSDFDDDLYFTATSGANIVSCTLDGVELGAESFTRLFKKTGSTASILKSAVEIPADMTSAKKWHKVVLTVRNANDASLFNISTASSHARPGTYGFYFDNFEVRSIYDASKKKSTTLRVLYWNVQNGMWADQDNNYNNFVAWVKKYNPDVCVWCEGETIFNTSGDKVYGTNRILPNAWASVAQRYGHNYWSKSEDRDNYPQIITSKYPINTLAKIGQIGTTDAYVEHGSGLFEVEFNGHSVYFVSFHAFAHAYDPKYTSSGTDAQNASAALYEGDYHREKEIRYVYEQTIEKYPSQSNWLMMGDFNSISSLDAEHHTGINDTNWLLHDHILGKDYLKDIIAERNAPEDFFSSINGDSRRIDFIYASPAMYDRIESTAIIIDSWTVLSQDKSVSDKGYFCRPSDHRPILVDFKMN